MKRILITGAGSYIGESVKKYLENEPDLYCVDMIDTVGYEPTISDFKGYDVVLNTAGIAHIKETKENRKQYFLINRDLCIKIAKNAKAAGVKQFILLSTMSVYGKLTGHITKKTKVAPKNAYGLSKAQADQYITKLRDKDFKFACLRPPMVYGKNCKGNYQSLRSFALVSPIFPYYHNERSMIYIGNLCEFIKQTINQEMDGLYFPQNAQYVCSSRLVKEIATVHERKIYLTKLFNCVLKLASISVIQKVFGSLTYEKTDVVNKYSFKESVYMTECDY